MLKRMQRNWVSYTLLVGMWNGTGTLKHSWVVSLKTKQATYDPQLLSWALSQRNANFPPMPTHNVNINVHSSLICISTKLETPTYSSRG